jgi:hypothetical protein
MLTLASVWTELALPTLKIVQPKLRHGAVVIADNTASSLGSYKAFLAYLRDSNNGFKTMTTPFKRGLEMAVYLP